MIRAYALNKAWLIGFLMDIFGALLMLRALSLAPVSVSAPSSICLFSSLHFAQRSVRALIHILGLVEIYDIC